MFFVWFCTTNKLNFHSLPAEYDDVVRIFLASRAGDPKDPPPYKELASVFILVVGILFTLIRLLDLTLAEVPYVLSLQSLLQAKKPFFKVGLIPLKLG